MAQDPTLANARAYAGAQGYQDSEFNAWYGKNMGAVAANAGSGGDWGRVESAFGKKKAAAPPPPAPKAAAVPAPRAPAAPVMPPAPAVNAPLAGLTAITAGTGTETQQAPAPQAAGGMGMMMEPEPPSPTGVASGSIGALRALGRRSLPMDTYALAGLKKIY